jgi:hypothetical protein
MRSRETYSRVIRVAVGGDQEDLLVGGAGADGDLPARQFRLQELEVRLQGLVPEVVAGAVVLVGGALQLVGHIREHGVPEVHALEGVRFHQLLLPRLGVEEDQLGQVAIALVGL